MEEKMNITKEQWIAVAKVVLAAVLAIAAIFGYDLGVIQPRERGLGALSSQGLGVERITHPVWIQNNTLKVDQAITASGGVVGNLTGNVTGNIASTGANTFGSVSATYLTGTTSIAGNLAGNVTSTGVNTFGSASATYLTGTTSIAGNLAGNVTSTGSNTFGTASSTYLTSTNAISMQGETFTGPIKYGTAANYTSSAAITHGFATTPTMCIIFPSRDVTETLTLATTTFASDRASQATPVYWMCGK
jgi:hypothetical protein